jgi:hypothetical protein
MRRGIRRVSVWKYLKQRDHTWRRWDSKCEVWCVDGLQVSFL